MTVHPFGPADCALRSRSRSSRGVVIAPTQRPGRSAAWKSLPAMPTSPSRSAQARIRWLLPLEKPGPSTSMACKPRSASARSVASRRSWGGVPARQRRRLPGSRRSPGRCRDEVCPRKPGIRRRDSVRRPRAYWPPGAFGQVVRQVAPTQAGAGKGPPKGVQIDREPERSQPRGHRLDSLGSASAKQRHRLQKRRIIVADEMPQDVNLATFVFAGQLDPRRQAQCPTAPPRAGRPPGPRPCRGR